MENLPDITHFTNGYTPNREDKLLYAILEVLHRIDGKTPPTSNMHTWQEEHVDVEDLQEADEQDDLEEVSASSITSHMASNTLNTDKSLSAWQSQQAIFSHDEDLAALFWPDGYSGDAEDFVRFIALAAQWSQVVKVWELLATRCKQEQRAVNAAELEALNHVLTIHNLIWSSRQASLIPVALNVPYDFKTMERGNTSGALVTEEWLPALQNAGGERVKNGLVKTR